MKKLFVLTMIIGFIWALPAFAWQDPCSAIENAYICEGYTLDDWVETGPHFSPAPECQGTVTLWAPDGTGYIMDYIGNNDVLMLSHVLLLDDVTCRVNDKGNLKCKVITQLEESVLVLFGQQE